MKMTEDLLTQLMAAIWVVYRFRFDDGTVTQGRGRVESIDGDRLNVDQEVPHGTPLSMKIDNLVWIRPDDLMRDFMELSADDVKALRAMGVRCAEWADCRGHYKIRFPKGTKIKACRRSPYAVAKLPCGNKVKFYDGNVIHFEGWITYIR